jgi:acetyl esterase/lipase
MRLVHPRLTRLLLLACGGLLLSAAAAHAAISTATTLSNPLVAGGSEIGRATLTATYAATTATASSSTQVQLPAGAQFKAMTCLNMHVLGSAPDARCAATDIDTRAAGTTKTYAVAALSTTIARPAAGASGYATQQVLITYASGATLADSWPATNIAGASLVLFALGAVSGLLPEQQGVPLAATAAHGGVNTYQPDSMCVANPWPAAAPRDDLAAQALGALPFHHEVGEPSGAYAGQRPKGVLLLFHGGGWMATGGGAVQAVRGEADRWRARGWRTVNSTYRACGLSVTDALALYDRVRAAYGATIPVCTMGQSAGGHLALMVALRRPGGVSCVIDDAGPTDAASLPAQTAADPATGGTQSDGPTALHNMMMAAFGEENLAAYSPARLTASLRGTRILAATAASDSLVPHEQMTLLRDAMRREDPDAYVDVMRLAAGDQPFVHAYVSRAALDDLYRAELALVAPLVGDGAGDTPLSRQDVARRDRTAPRARLTARRRQRLGPRLAVQVRCIDETCRAVARAAVAVPKPGSRRARTYTSAPTRTSISAGRRTTISIRLPRVVRAAAARTLRAHRGVTARVTVVVSDAAGNRRTLKTPVSLAR